MIAQFKFFTSISANSSSISAIVFLFFATVAWSADVDHFKIAAFNGTEQPFQVCFSSDGSKVAAAADGGQEIAVYDVSKGTVIQRILTPTKVVYSLAFSPDDSVIATGNAVRVRVFELTSGKLKCDFRSEGLSRTLQFSPDGSQILTCARTVQLWSLSDNSPAKIAESQGLGAYSAYFSPTANSIGCVVWSDRKRAEDAPSPGDIEILDPKTLKSLETFGPHEFSSRLVFSNDAKKVIGFYDRKLTIWPLATEFKVQEIDNKERITSCGLSHDGKILAIQGFNGLVLRNAETGEIIGKWKDIHSEWIAFSKDDSRVFCASIKGDVNLFEVPRTKLKQ